MAERQEVQSVVYTRRKKSVGDSLIVQLLQREGFVEDPSPTDGVKYLRSPKYICVISVSGGFWEASYDTSEGIKVTRGNTEGTLQRLLNNHWMKK